MFTFKDVPSAYIEIIGQGLDLLPYGKVKPVADFLQTQINEQLIEKIEPPHKPRKKQVKD